MRTLRMVGVGLVLGLAIAGVATGSTHGGSAVAPTFTRPTAITNAYLPLSKFRRCELAGVEGGSAVRVVRRLLTRTQPFLVRGRTVQTAVIEDRAYEDGSLVERTLDFFAQADDGTVYYFGEDVDDYADGKLVGHHGSWRYGRDTDTLGVAMPAHPRVGTAFRFEDVPGITIESDRVVARLPRVDIGGTAYRGVLRVRELLRPEQKVEHKLYARGVGVIRELPPDGRVELVGCT